MIFLRRPDLTPQARLWMALSMHFRNGADWGMVSDLAREHGVSRQFLYENARRLLGVFSETGPGMPALLSDEWVHRLILCLRMHCGSSLEGISRTLGEMGLSPGSTGHVSEFLDATAGACSLAVPGVSEVEVLLLDEIFANMRPILVTMDAASHCILSIKIMSDRKAETWAAELRSLREGGVEIGLLVKDQGTGLKAAAKSLGLPERADLFHLLNSFDPSLGSLERRAYGAISKEDETLRVFGNRKSEESLAKLFARCEAAAAETAAAIRASDNFEYLHECLHEAFDSFTADGRTRTRSDAERDIKAAMDLFEEEFPACDRVMKAARFLRKNLKDHLGYFDQLANIMERQAELITEHTLRALCLAWQLDRKAMAVKGHGNKKRLLGQSKAQREFALAGDDGRLEAARRRLSEDLDSNVRSSSPLEAINSVIRRHLDSCRGQTTQDALTMLAFFMNHKVADRGKYAGSSPHQRMTGLAEKASPIEQLMTLAPRSCKWRPRKAETAISETETAKAA